MACVGSTQKFVIVLASLFKLVYASSSSDLYVSSVHEPQEKGTVWPKPQIEKRKLDTLYTFLPRNFEFRLSKSGDELLTHAIQRYIELFFPDQNLLVASNLLEIKLLLIVVEDYTQGLGPDMDESYELLVSAPTSVIKAQSRWGALRALETFSHLVFRQNDSYVAHHNKIIDYPRFTYRGFLIDTSRHYLPLSIILKFLDAMSYNKFNVLHWHIVDDPSFPFVSKNFPELHSHGAYNPRTHVYTPNMVKRVIEYARQRGIRVMPEFDTPGHTLSWKGIKGLLVNCVSFYDSPHDPFDQRGTIDPLRESNYDFLATFLKEVAETFPDKFLHLGGDEVDYRCWLNNTQIANWFSEHNAIPDGRYLQTFYQYKIRKIVESLNKFIVLWQDVFDDKANISRETIIQVWKPTEWQAELSNVTRAGYYAILSSCWYLDYHGYGYDWHQHYLCDPHNFTGTEKQKALVLGGSAAIWGEFVDATNVISRSFGRGFAVAERLWSSEDVRDLREARPRIWEQQCRHVRRGIPAEPVAKNRYCTFEWDPQT